MKRSPRLRIAFAVGTLALAQAACVSQGSYKEIEQERDQLRSDLDALQMEVQGVHGELAATEAASVENAARSAELIRELEAEVSAGEIRIRQAVDGITIDVADQLLFGSGSTNLSQEGRALLSRIAKQISSSDSVISVEGHTDSWMVQASKREIYPSNWELGASRAAKVVKRLSAEGVDPAKLRVVSFGPFHPVASNDSPEGRRKNRRIAIVLRTAD
ncbi:MAG: OmpA family protein [Deltaproteobacteria bacterium]|nr:OmpA family protein [Deltaproteobacteria bacterium]MBW2726592.1 OmpA family protein [Deltaproteobacteria bacterium]